MSDPVRAKIVELLWPVQIVFVNTGAGGAGGAGGGGEAINRHEQVSLADVLRAIEAKTKEFVDLDDDKNEAVWREAIEKDAIELLRIWNLATDYNGQTDETKAFIGRLLGV